MADRTDTRSGDRSPSSILVAGGEYLRVGGAVLGVIVAVGLGVILANRIAVAIVETGAARNIDDATPVALGHVAMIGVVVLAVIGVARFKAEGFLAGTWVFAPLAPVMAAAVSVSAYLVAPEDPARPGVPLHPVAPVYVGLAAALFGLMLFAFLGTQIARRDHAQMRVYNDLLRRYRSLEARVVYETERVESADPADAAAKQTKALIEARSGLVAIRRQLIDPDHAGPALRWVLAHGYTGIARDLHRVEEALIAVQGTSEVVGDALHDDLSLEDSGLKNRFTLRRVIRDAMPSISEAATDALLRPVPALPQTAALVMRAQAATTPKLSREEAREALREVRYALNDYRDDIVDSFARGRNRVIWTFIAVALSTHVLLGLGLLSGIPKTSLIGIALLYLVGSLIGLFSRLRIESSSPSTNEDYGLYLARLITGPLLSGLAGVAGVYIIAQAPAFLGPLAEIGAPAASAAPSGSPAVPDVIVATQPKALADIYDLSRNHLALLVAAIFGLAPSLLTSRLQQQVDRLERDLQRSEPATNASVGGAAPEGGAEDVHG